MRRTSFDELTPRHTAVAMAVCGYMLRVYGHDQEGRKTLLLLGEAGRGKSHLARQVRGFVNDIGVRAWHEGYWPRPITCGFWSWAKLVEPDGSSTLRDALEADVAVIDDIGSEKDQFRSGAPTETLRQFLDDREHRFTMLTTNVPAHLWAERWDGRVADRLLSKAVQTVSFEGIESWRITGGVTG